MTEQILVFGALFVRLASCRDSLYAFLGSAVGKLLSRNVQMRRLQRVLSGGVYIGLGLTTVVLESEKK